jgi:putative addiction module component (TIGR02574 family)
MAQSFEQVFHEALSLPEEERVHLVDALIASFDDSASVPLDYSWLEAIKKRTAEYEAGLVQLVPWDDVKEQVRARVGFHG